MAGPAKKSKKLESSKSSPDPSTPQTPLVEHKGNTYETERLHPNHTLPAYRPPSKQRREADVQCSFDPKAVPPKRKKRKAD